MNAGITILENFIRTRDAISAGMAGLIELGEAVQMPEETAILKEFSNKLAENIFRIIVIGEFKRGKSTFINAMLGGKILPVGITPTTATVNVIRYAGTASATVKYRDKSEKAIPLAELADYVTTKSKETAKIDTVTVYYPAALCRENVEIVDSPGVNDIDEQRVEITYDYIPKCDAAIFVMNATQQFSASEREFLTNKVNKYINKIFFILNKIDQLSEAEQAEASAYVNGEMQKITASPKIFPLSAKTALNARLENNPDGLAESKLPAFETELFQFLIRDKGRVVLEAPIQRSFNTIDKIKLAIEMKLKASEMSLAELEEKVELANKEFSQLRSEKNEILDIIPTKKAELLNRLLSDIKLSVYTFQDKVEVYINTSTASTPEDIQRNTVKYLEDQLQQWGKTEEEFVGGEVAKLMQYIELKTSNIRKKTEEIQLNFIGADNILNEAVGTEGPTTKEKHFVFDIIPEFLNNKMGELSGVARGAIFIFGAALLTGGALIPAILLGSAASFITGTVLKDFSEKRQKKELVSRFKESLESLPAKISENITANIEKLFENDLKKQVLGEIDAIINTAQNTLLQISSEKRDKESETESNKTQLISQAEKLKTIEADLKSIKESLVNL